MRFSNSQGVSSLLKATSSLSQKKRNFSLVANSESPSLLESKERDVSCGPLFIPPANSLIGSSSIRPTFKTSGEPFIAAPMHVLESLKKKAEGGAKLAICSASQKEGLVLRDKETISLTKGDGKRGGEGGSKERKFEEKEESQVKNEVRKLIILDDEGGGGVRKEVVSQTKESRENCSERRLNKGKIEERNRPIEVNVIMLEDEEEGVGKVTESCGGGIAKERIGGGGTMRQRSRAYLEDAKKELTLDEYREFIHTIHRYKSGFPAPDVISQVARILSAPTHYRLLERFGQLLGGEHLKLLSAHLASHKGSLLP